MVRHVNKKYITKRELILGKQMIANGMVDAIIKVGRDFLYHNSPETTIIINRDKYDRNNNSILFIDAREYTRGINDFSSEWKRKNVYAIAALHQKDFTPFEELRHDYEEFFEFPLTDIGEMEKTIENNIGVRLQNEYEISTEKASREMEDAEKERIQKLEAMGAEAKWLSDNCGDGQYHDIPGFCKEVKTEELLNDKASLDPSDYVNED